MERPRPNGAASTRHLPQLGCGDPSFMTMRCDAPNDQGPLRRSAGVHGRLFGDLFVPAGGRHQSWGQYAPIGRGETYGNVGTTGRYSGKTTICCQPLTGEKFAKSLMTPIPVSGFLFLIQSGYPADPFCGSASTRSAAGRTPMAARAIRTQAIPKHLELMTALRASQAAGDTGFRVKPGRGNRAS